MCAQGKLAAVRADRGGHSPTLRVSLQTVGEARIVVKAEVMALAHILRITDIRKVEDTTTNAEISRRPRINGNQSHQANPTTTEEAERDTGICAGRCCVFFFDNYQLL